MNDDRVPVPLPPTAIDTALPMAEAARQAEEFTRATLLQTYQEGLRNETKRRQQFDLNVFATFLQSIGVRPGKFYEDLDAWRDVNAGLLQQFVEWQKRQGYAIGSINVRLATVKQYCHLALQAGKISTDTHIYIDQVKGITRQHARNIDANRTRARISTKKAQPVEIPLDQVKALKHPETGFLAKRDALLMCLLLDHGLRVGEIALLKKTQFDLKYIHPSKNRKEQRKGLLMFHRPKVDKKQRDGLTLDTYKAAKAYLPTIPPEQESLFDLAIISLEERVRTLGELVGIKGLSPHDCRHSWATRAARNGTPLERLRQAGRWSNVETPLRYIRESEIDNEGVILE